MDCQNKRNVNILYKFMLLIVLFANIQIPYLETFSTFNKIYNILIIITFMISLCIFFKRAKISKMQLLIFLFYGIYLLSTLFNKGNYRYLLTVMVSAFTIIIISDLYVRKYYNVFLSITTIFFELLIYINLLTVIFCPNGLYENLENKNNYYFLGHRNDSIEYILPGICVSFLYSYYKFRKINIRALFLIFASFLTVILTWSATAMVAIGILILFFVLPTKEILQKFTKLWHYFVMSVVLFFMFVIFRLQYYFGWFIENVLHRSMDFTFRDQIWDRAIYYIGKSPFFGYGYEDAEVKLSKIGHENSAHNYYLDFLYSGGIILVAVYLLMIGIISKALGKIKELFESKIMTGILAAYFIVGFATPVHVNRLSLMFMIFIIAYNLQYIVQNKKEN